MIRPLIAALAALAAAHASASGGGWSPNFANSYSTDIALARYQNGELGIVRQGYQRVYLYAAWRAIALGPEGLKKAPNPADALARARGDFGTAWGDAGDRDKYKTWAGQVEAALGKGNDSEAPVKELAYLSCPGASYDFATATLGELARRKDANRARLQAWIRSQRQVFRICGDDPDQPRDWDRAKWGALPLPAELPAGEPLYWRQMQQYQIAAAAFYNGDYVRSRDGFAAIGATNGHPLRPWGAYLALRALSRGSVAAKAAPEDAVDAMRAVADAGDAILENPALAARHEDARALVRAARALLTPNTQFAQLSALLDRPESNPYQDDHLGDWRVIANHLADNAAGLEPWRAKAAFIDWIATLSACSGAKCDEQAAHALRQWQAAVTARDDAQARTWLTAAAILAKTMTPALEKAALKVDPAAPEYLTIRHALQRHYRLGGHADMARAVGDALLSSAQLTGLASLSARNLVTGERFAAASSLDDAARFLMRTVVSMGDGDSGELRESKEPARVQPDDDGLHWLNTGLSVASLNALAGSKHLPAPMRLRVAVAAWMRADLLADSDEALKGAANVEKLSPLLAETMRSYRTLAPAARHDLMLTSALRYGLTPTFSEGDLHDFSLRKKDEVRTDMWCNVAGYPEGEFRETRQATLEPVLPAAAMPAQTAALGKLKTATGYYGDFILARANSMPKDPELPWLLHVLVQSTRGGCLDHGASALSKTAFALLHKRFKGNEWTRKTPYHY